MNIRSAFIIILLLANAAMIFIFVDGLAAVGRYDAGIKSYILHSCFISIATLILATFCLAKVRLAKTFVILSIITYLPLFLHECLPGIIGLFDTNYRTSMDGIVIVPFVRFDLSTLTIITLFLIILFCLSRKNAKGLG